MQGYQDFKLEVGDIVRALYHFTCVPNIAQTIPGQLFEVKEDSLEFFNKNLGYKFQFVRKANQC